MKRFLWMAAILLASTASIPLWPGIGVTELERTVGESLVLIADGDLLRARSTIDRATTLDRTNVDVRLIRMQIAAKRFNTSEGMDDLLLVFELEGEQAPALIKAALDTTTVRALAYQLYLRGGDALDIARESAERKDISLGESLVLLDRALALNDALTEAMVTRAIVYQEQGRHRNAVSDLDAAIRLSPSDWRAHLSRGLSYRELGYMTAALEDYDRAVELGSQDSESYGHRGSLHQFMGDQTLAIVDFTEAIKLAPNVPVYFFNRGYSYFQQGELEPAVADLREAHGLAPEDENILLFLSQAELAAGNFVEAVAGYSELIEQDSQNSIAHYERAIAECALGDEVPAFEDLRQGRDLSPAYEGFYLDAMLQAGCRLPTIDAPPV